MVGKLREANLCNICVFMALLLLLWVLSAAPGLWLFKCEPYAVNV